MHKTNFFWGYCSSLKVVLRQGDLPSDSHGGSPVSTLDAPESLRVCLGLAKPLFPPCPAWRSIVTSSAPFSLPSVRDRGTGALPKRAGFRGIPGKRWVFPPGHFGAPQSSLPLVCPPGCASSHGMSFFWLSSLI